MIRNLHKIFVVLGVWSFIHVCQCSEVWELQYNALYNVTLGVLIFTNKSTAAKKISTYSAENINSFSYDDLCGTLKGEGLKLDLIDSPDIIDALEHLKKGGLGVFNIGTRDVDNKQKTDNGNWILISYSHSRDDFIVDEYPDLGVVSGETALVERLNQNGIKKAIFVEGNWELTPRLDYILQGNAPVEKTNVADKSKEDASITSGLYLSIPKNVNIEGVLRLPDIFPVQFKIDNAGVSDVQIFGIRGSCSCVKKILFDPIIKGGGVGVVTAYIDLGAHLSQDSFSSQLAIMNSDPKVPQALVNLKIAFDNSSYYFISPQVIDKGVIDLKKTSTLSQEVAIYSKNLPDKNVIFESREMSAGLIIKPLQLKGPIKVGDFWQIAHFNVNINLVGMEEGGKLFAFAFENNQNKKVILPCRIKAFLK